MMIEVLDHEALTAMVSAVASKVTGVRPQLSPALRQSSAASFFKLTSQANSILLTSPFFLLGQHAIMLSRRVLVASRFLRSTRAPHLRYPSPVIQQFRLYADRVVKVPEMAESISEGTLKQWSKQIGDFVEQDEEIATIETDKVCDNVYCS
jgi:hypothetical protein